MKKTLFTLILLLSVVLMASAQIPKGTFAVGGDVSYTTGTGKSNFGGDEYKSTGAVFGIAPHVGFFITEHIEVGMELGYQYDKTTYQVPIMIFELKPTPEFWNKEAEVTIGPFIEYYSMCTEKVGMTLRATGLYSKGTSESQSVDYSSIDQTTGTYSYMKGRSKSSSMGIVLTPGLIFFPTQRLGVTVEVGALAFFKETSKPDPDEPEQKSEYTDFSAELTLSSISVGIEYYFRK